LRTRGLIAVLLACAVLVGGCGSDEDGESTAPSESAGQTEGAKVIDIASMDGAKGSVTFCTGKDTSGDRKDAIAQFNKNNPELQAKMVEFPESADEQRNQFVQRQRAKSSECDVFYSDVIWTAEFASQKWLYDLTPYVERRQDGLIPSTLATVKYDGRLWGMPKQTDAAFLYYRTDQVDQPPDTWQQVYEQAAARNGIAYQGAAYEGLTCDFLEIAFAAGGRVLSDDGSKAQFDSPENVKALQFMVDGIDNGAAPKAVTTYMEEPARRAFESGRVTFMRNWPYAYALGLDAPKIKDKFAVMPLPQFEGGGRASILGGHNLVISAFSKNPGAALKLIDYLSSEEVQKIAFTKFSLAPTIASIYDEPDVKKLRPFAPQQKQAVEQANPRPVSPVYPQISQAIYKNVNLALSGEASPEEAIKQAQEDIEQALQTF
jgi:multiple sugar transport system substrate-binding protein